MIVFIKRIIDHIWLYTVASRPAHYVALKDENGFTADRLMALYL